MLRLAILFACLLTLACDTDRARLILPTSATPAPPVAPPPPSAPPRSSGPTLTAAHPISLGQSMSGVVRSDDPVCFPNWDSSGRCQQYEVRVTAGGILAATLTGSGPPRGFYSPELFIVAPNGDWTPGSEDWPERRAAMRAEAGDTFRLVVISYGPFPDAFDVRADFQPRGAPATIVGSSARYRRRDDAEIVISGLRGLPDGLLKRSIRVIGVIR